MAGPARSMQTSQIKTAYGAATVVFVRGVVAHADRQFETEVWSEGGGGHVGPHGGYVRAAQVHSQTTEHQDIFVREPGGQEYRFALQDWKLGVRPGSNVAVGFESLPNSKTEVFRVRNMDTGQDLQISGWDQWMQEHGLMPTLGTSFWRVSFIAIVLALIMLIFFSYLDVRQHDSPYRNRSQAAHVQMIQLERGLSQREAAWRSLPRARRATEAEPAALYARAERAARDANDEEARARTNGAVPWPGLSWDTLNRTLNQLASTFDKAFFFGCLSLCITMPVLWLFISWPRRMRHNNLCKQTFVVVQHQFNEAFTRALSP